MREQQPVKDAPGWRTWLRALGPGVITGSANDDPSAVATFVQAGALYGYGMVWTAPVVLPLMVTVQEMSDRTATATGESLGALVRRRFGPVGRFLTAVLLACLLVANVVNVAADLMAVGQGMQLLGLGLPQVWAPVAGIAVGILLVTGSYRTVARVFTWLCLALLAYVAVVFIAGVHWNEVLAGLTFQRLSPEPQFWGLLAAVFGTSVSPYLFFWESGQRIEELRLMPEGGENPLADPDLPDGLAQRRRRQQKIDVVAGMTVSTLVMFAIIVATGATLGQQHQDVNTAAEAAKALQPLAGPLAGVIFALGFIGAGLLGVPVLASSACIGLTGLTGRDWGFDRSPRKAPLFYGLLIVGLVVATVVSMLSTDAIGMLVLSATLNAIAAAPFLVVLLLIAGSKRIMGERRNSPLSNVVGWFTAVIMAVAGAFAIWSQFAH
jgi:Mn2+/Fe2+ NRAMP family transporter